MDFSSVILLSHSTCSQSKISVSYSELSLDVAGERLGREGWREGERERERAREGEVEGGGVGVGIERWVYMGVGEFLM